jgi:hypothetical protein
MQCDTDADTDMHLYQGEPPGTWFLACNDQPGVPWTPVHARSLPMSVCVRLSHGSLLQHYHARAILHCGVSDSQGRVFHIDQAGKAIAAMWTDVICVPFSALGASNSTDAAVFDEALLGHHAVFPAIYDFDANNCFDYVVHFACCVLGLDGIHTKASLAPILEPAIADAALFAELTRAPQPMPIVHLQQRCRDRAVFAKLCTTLPYHCDNCLTSFEGHVWRWRCPYTDTDICDACTWTLLHV